MDAERCGKEGDDCGYGHITDESPGWGMKFGRANFQFSALVVYIMPNPCSEGDLSYPLGYDGSPPLLPPCGFLGSSTLLSP